MDWVDVFTRPTYRHIIVDALRYCQQHKNLALYAWCLMSNHLHLIASTPLEKHLSDILRDFKRHTSKAITTAIQRDSESRRQWMLHRFAYNARTNTKSEIFEFWQDGNEAKELMSVDFTMQNCTTCTKTPCGPNW